MKLSDNGLHKIEGYEGYGKALPDGGCVAYQDTYHGKKDVPTIGFGCTENVEMGMVWSRAEADAAFLIELAKHEAAVNRMVTVEMNQNEFDALVSFSYNVGSGALARSSVLKKLNADDRTGAAGAFALWNKAGGGVVDGLVRRRASEAALFLKPIEPLPAPAMPQTVDPPPTPVQEHAPKAAAGGLFAGLYAWFHGWLDPITSHIDANMFLDGVQNHGPQIKALVASGLLIYALGGVGVYLVVCVFIPKWAGGKS